MPCPVIWDKANKEFWSATAESPGVQIEEYRLEMLGLHISMCVCGVCMCVCLYVKSYEMISQNLLQGIGPFFDLLYLSYTFDLTKTCKQI